MIRARPRGLARALFTTASLALLAACTSSSQEANRCMDIPANGCLASATDVCTDPTCAATYVCNSDGSWTLDHACPAFDAGARDASHIVDAPPPRDTSGIDAPPGANGGPGCDALEAPDCTLGLALACPASAGCCDCETLFVCQSGAWVTWGECLPDGGIVASGN